MEYFVPFSFGKGECRVDASETAPLNGRRAQAARNDQRILDAARAVFTADPEAPIAAVAERAGVGISALYRRYVGKEDLLQRLALDGLQRYVSVAEASLADTRDPWLAFADFMRSELDAGANSLSVRFAGSFVATPEMHRLGQRGYELTQRLLDRAKAAGAVRADITTSDLTLIFEQVQSIRIGDEERMRQLRHRALALFLDALRHPGTSALPGPPPTWEELSRRYDG